MTAPNRIPTGLYQADKIVGGRSPKDLLLTIGVPVGLATVLTIMGFYGPFVYLGVIFLCLAGAAVIFRMAGTRSVDQYLQEQVNWIRKPRRISRFGGEDPPKDELLIGDGGPFDPDDFTDEPGRVSFWKDAEEFGDAPYVKDVFPDFDVVRRQDGLLMTAVRVDGTQVFLRSPKEKQRLTESFHSVFKETEFDFDIFVTTDTFDFQEHIDTIEDAGYNDAVQSNPILKQIHSAYYQKVLQNPSFQAAQQRVTYAVVTANPEEVHDILEGDDGTESSIAAVRFFKSLFGDSNTDGDYSEEELKDLRATAKQLLQRRDRLARSISNIDDVDCEPVDASELVGRLRSHWQGPHQYEEYEFSAATITPPEELIDSAHGTEEGSEMGSAESDDHKEAGVEA